ncbi:tail fiber domain-containing protein [Microbacterium testaceum]|uniref:tail fiber domain-containing protein n=1 Tax=Microbacterium testaceum TaxID=2033 RepID=UPI0022E7881C|nr:tail fiber domain-containing protein [Microbacterium testaceum]
MATGDDAVAEGIDLVPGNGMASDLDFYINRLADELAKRSRFTKGSTALAIRTSLGISAANTPTTTADVQTDLDFLARQKLDRTIEQYNADFADRDARIGAAQSRADEGNVNGIAARQGNLYTDSYNRAISGTRRALVIQDNGQLGYAASTERLKKNIRPEDVTDEQVLMLALVSYQWRAAVAVDDRREMGLIAERLIDAGLGWACFYDGDGTVEGINYEMVGVALLPAVQRLIAHVHRLDDDLDVLAQRLDALERNEG